MSYKGRDMDLDEIDYDNDFEDFDDVSDDYLYTDEDPELFEDSDLDDLDD